MKSCFMFGHSDCPDSMLPRIEQAIEHYYSQYGVADFYIGNRGRFDSLAATAVRRCYKITAIEKMQGIQKIIIQGTLV